MSRPEFLTPREPVWNWPVRELSHGGAISLHSLAADELQVWAMWLHGHSGPTLATAWTHLAPAEQARANRYRHARDRDHYIVHHSALRQFLGRFLQCPPHQVPIEIQPNGKPILGGASPDLHFSLSRSAGVGLLAFTRSGPVGVDVEYIRDFPERDAIIETHFTACEQQALAQLLPEERSPAFFDAWTLKEAVVKATGEGIQSLDEIEVNLSGPRCPGFRRLNATDSAISSWRSAALAPSPKWVGHLVGSGNDQPLQSIVLATLKLCSADSVERPLHQHLQTQIEELNPGKCRAGEALD